MTGSKNLLGSQESKPYDTRDVTATGDAATTETADGSQWTVEEAIERGGFGYFQWRLLFLTGGIWAADAMEMMFISFVVPILREEWNLEAPWDAAIGIVVFAGMMMGAFGWSMLADIKGRRPILIVTNVIAAVFGLLCGLAPNLFWLLLFRFFVGVALGGSGVSYTLFAEYAPSSWRGKALIIEQGCWSGGALLSVGLAWIVLSSMGDEVGWRWYVSLSTIPLWMIIACIPIVPESARYYSGSQQFDKATAVLKEMYRVNGKEFIKGEIKRHTEKSQPAQLRDLFVPAYRRTSIILLISFFFWTFCYYGICFVSDRVFTGSDDLYIAMFVTTLAEIPGLVVGMFVLDWTGRKGMMSICWIAFAICSTILAVTDRSDVDIAWVFIGRGFVSLGFYVLFIYFSEYYPTVIRTTALGTGSAIARIAGMITTYIAEDFEVSTATLIYGVAAFGTLMLNIALPQDTTGRALSDNVDRGTGVELSEYMKHNDLQDKRLIIKERSSTPTEGKNGKQHPEAVDIRTKE